MKYEIVDLKGKKSGEIELNDQVWTLGYNKDLVAQCVYVYQSNERAGTANAKGRGDVSGGGRKPWKQKGTGRARSGSNRSPVWVGGGVPFTPNERNWGKRVNKGMKLKALAIMLSKRAKDNMVTITESVDGVDRPQFVNDKSVLLVADNKELVLRFRNVPQVKVVNPSDVNALDIVSAKKVFFDKESVSKLESRFSHE